MESGLNPYLLEIVNIREHCTWVHTGEPEEALAKALELIRMGLAKVRLTQPLADRQVPVTRQVLVIGGGPAGLRAALDIADAGYPVTLVEREPVLGGMANRLHRTFPHGQTALSLINPLMAAVALHPGIQVLTAGEVTEVTGHLGNYQMTVRQQSPAVADRCDLCDLCAAACPIEVRDGRQAGLANRKAIYLPSPTAFPGRYALDLAHCDRCGHCVPACPHWGAIDLNPQEIEHHLTVGAMVVAPGFRPFDPAGSRYEPWATLPQVITTVALERLLAPNGPTQGRLLMEGAETEPQDIAFIMCVGSRETTATALALASVAPRP